MRPRRTLPTAKEPRATRKNAKAAPRQHFYKHPLFGKVPLVPRPVTVHTTGETYIVYEYDLGYAPPLPRGAVRGNPHRQELGSYSSFPRYFYVDEHKECVQCGKAFVFEAREQKYWYETLKFCQASTAIRCRKCRRQRRSEKSVRMQLAAVKSELKHAPDDPVLLLTMAEATVRYRRFTGEGKLAEAIRAARRSYQIAPRAHEAVFWEAFCHIQGGREAKGRELLMRFVELPLHSRKQRDLLREAKQHLDVNKEAKQ